MAESQQVIVYDADLLDALEGALSAARLAPYLRASKGDRKAAVLLYLWNSRLSKAFLFPLNIAEVTVRNFMHAALSARYGRDWIFNPPFQLTAESEQSRQAAFRRLKPRATADDFVAALTFDFWSNLFRRDYRPVWDDLALLRQVFPDLPQAWRRGQVQLLVARINQFRNRIAHHEPIHAADHRSLNDDIVTLITLCDPRAADWVRGCSTVMAVVRTPPTRSSALPGAPLSSTNLRPPTILTAADTVATAMGRIAVARPALILVTGAGADPVLVSSDRVAAYLAGLIAKDGALMDLNDHTLQDLLDATPPALTKRIAADASTGDAQALFFPLNTAQADRPHALLVYDGSVLRGVMLHPVTRYR